MKRHLRNIAFLAVLILTIAGPAAQAQSKAPVDPNAMLNAGIQAAQMIDAGRAGELWDGASAITKRAVTRKAFQDQVKKARDSIGTAASRDWLSVTRETIQDKNTGGEYISLRYAVSFAKRPGVELISFRRDEDGMWRWAGYVVQ
ncbi:MAG: DUF4019 domain-containing protein [Lysobacter sp.]